MSNDDKTKDATLGRVMDEARARRLARQNAARELEPERRYYPMLTHVIVVPDGDEP